VITVLHVVLRFGAVVPIVAASLALTYAAVCAGVGRRLGSSAMPGSIQVSGAVHERRSAHFFFSEPCVVQLKGKGPARARILTECLPARPAIAVAAGLDGTECDGFRDVTP
jgi:hypothetical protein